MGFILHNIDDDPDFTVNLEKGGGGGGGGGVQSAQRATPGEKVPGSFPAVAARSLLVGSLSV